MTQLGTEIRRQPWQTARGTKTLQDVMDVVKASPDLRELPRRTIMSGLRTLARCLNKAPRDILATPAALQKELAGANPLLAGLTKRRWTNVRSLTLTALRLSGANIMPGRRNKSVFTKDWLALREQCDTTHYRAGLSRFMNFCSANGIAPSSVDAAVFDSFRQHLEENSIVRNTPKVLRATCQLWNKATDNIPGWPSYRTKQAAAPRNYSLPWSAYPSTLVADVEAFLSHGGNQDIFADDYAPSVRPATTVLRRQSLRLMATALVTSGMPIGEIRDLSVFVRPDNAAKILRFFYKRNGDVKSETLHGHACLLRTVARTWVKNVSDYSKLDELRRKLSIKRKGMKESNRIKLRQFDNEKNLSALLALPAKLVSMARQRNIGSGTHVPYALYAAAIEILIYAPMRITNVVGLQIGRTIILPRPDGDGRIFICIPGEEVKNGSPIETYIPAAASKLLLSYIQEFRPSLCDEPSDFLFPNQKGGKRNVRSFSTGLSATIERHTGLVMHAHLFRHLALKILDKEKPGSVEIGRRLLGHRNIQTTLSSYSESNAQVAHKLFEAIIDNKRAEIHIRARRKGAA
jgi:integrase